MRSFILSFLSCLLITAAQTQPVQKDLSQIEDALKPHAMNMIFNKDETIRFAEDSIFTRAFVQALRVPYSFNYPFDSIITVSKIYSPDSSFRIFTWQYQKNENYFRQRGAIQMKTTDGSLKLFPLFDMSEFTNRPTDSLRTNQNWIGALYYGIVKKSYNNKDYYTLFGYDDNNMATTRKWLDILTFDEAGKPVFGGRTFSYKPDSLKPAQPAYRFLLQYKKDARARMIYDPEMDMIVFDHLVSDNNDQSDASSLVPDGDYEGFQWKDGQWVHVSKIFNQKIDMSKVDPMLGNAPMEDAIINADGTRDEKKLLERSAKTLEKQKQKEAEKKTPPKKKKD
jgi:hypothetical protein